MSFFMRKLKLFHFVCGKNLIISWKAVQLVTKMTEEATVVGTSPNCFLFWGQFN